MYLVGKQIADRSGATLTTSIGESLKGCEKVVTLIPEGVPRLEQARRFMGFKKVILFIAGSWDAFTLWEKGSIIAHATEHPVVVPSPYVHATAINDAKHLLSPAKLRQFMKNLHYIPYGVSEEFSPARRNPYRWIVPYNRVEVGPMTKNVSVHREITEKFKIMMRGKTEHRFIMLKAPGYEKNIDLSCYEVVEQPPTREEYLQLIADRGGFLCTSLSESFGIYYLELLCSGVVGVFLDTKWVRMLLPNYPLIAENKVHALALMKEVVEDYDHWHKVIVEEWVSFIRNTYDLNRFVATLFTL